MKDSTSSGETCLACGKTIQGTLKVMRLQITEENAKLAQRAKELGFVSKSWREGDFLQGTFDRKCFETAILIWQVAFHTRLVRPRR